MYQTQMKACFDKYKAYPMRSMMFPLLQLPVFMSMFLGLKVSSYTSTTLPLLLAPTLM